MKDATIPSGEVALFKLPCPFCNGEMIVRETYYTIPYLGRVVIVSKKCSKCGYRRNDIIPLEKKPRKRLYFRVEETSDMYAKIVRSNVSRVEIPELGVEIDPGVDAPMFITNVEGLISRVEDALERLKVLSGESPEDTIRCNLAMKKLEEIKGCKSPFTIIIDDPLGISSVLMGDKAPGAKVITEFVEGDVEG